jgi:hypothetical protein
VIKDGNLGRAADILQGKEIVLEVFSKGTVVTGWEKTIRKEKDEHGVRGIGVVCYDCVVSRFALVPCVARETQSSCNHS